MSSKLPERVQSFLQKLDLEKTEFFISEFESCAKTVKSIERKKAANQLVTPATINRELNDLAASFRSLNKKLQRTREDSIVAGELFINLLFQKESTDESQSGSTNYVLYVHFPLDATY